MRAVNSFMLLCLLGIIMLSGCSKEDKIYIPISFTDKEGNYFIKIDTATNNIEAYSKATISQGRLRGVFSDTIRSSFYLAVITDSYWNNHYHPKDTVILPTHYSGNTISIETHIDLRDCSSPYHFILLGLPKNELKCSSHGIPSVMFTVDTHNE
ncbi:MAG: hypothetical protein NTW10_01310 [Bacteroidetes bacterium]|nr:hypothetical protein [Bacteroidota bacterium]